MSSAQGCPSCGTPLAADLRCSGCGSRFALVPAPETADERTRLLVALGGTRDPAERRRIRHELSRVLATDGRADLLLALWSDADGPEADLWRGVAAVLAQPATTLPAVPPLERAQSAFLADGRRDLLAIARAWLVHALLSEQRVREAEEVGDAAIAAAIEERDGESLLRAAYTRYSAIAHDLRLQYRTAQRRLGELVEMLRAWDPACARRLAQGLARVMVRSDPSGAERLMREVGVGPERVSRSNELRFRAELAIVRADAATSESTLAELTAAADAGDSEIPRYVALRRSELANVLGRPSDALALARAAMPPTWHRSCFLRVEARLARVEALARLLPADALDRRRRGAWRAIRHAERFRAAGITWREMRFRLLAGELLRSVRMRREATRELARARVLAERLGVPTAVERIDAHLRALGVGAGAAAARGLTRRETEVARLIGEGATNAEIAGRLVLSEATVARHVSNILLKLDLRSRREIAAFLRQRELHSS